MAWEEDSCICLNMQLIAILSRIGVIIYNVLKFIFRFNSYCGDSKINKCIPGDVVILKLTTG